MEYTANYTLSRQANMTILINDITGYVVIVILIILISVFFLFTFTIANVITKFRRNDLLLKRTTLHDYFKIKAILTSVSFSLNDLFLHFKFLEHLLVVILQHPYSCVTQTFFQIVCTHI